MQHQFQLGRHFYCPSIVAAFIVSLCSPASKSAIFWNIFILSSKDVLDQSSQAFKALLIAYSTSFSPALWYVAKTWLWLWGIPST